MILVKIADASEEEVGYLRTHPSAEYDYNFGGWVLLFRTLEEAAIFLGEAP